MSIPDLLSTLPTASKRLPFGNLVANDPMLVWDSTPQVVLFHSAPAGNIWRWVTPDLSTNRNWSGKTQISTGSKPFLMIDGNGNPVQVGGLYHLFYINAGANPSVGRMTASTVAATSWTDHGTELAFNTSVSLTPDGFGILAVSAYYIGGQVLLLYMGCPGINGVGASDVTYGYASRGCYANASAPGGTYTRGGAWLNPSTTPGDRDEGWIGGQTITLDASGTDYDVIYNAGGTRPTSSGTEPSVGGPTAGLAGVICGGKLTGGIPGTGTFAKNGSNPLLTPDAPDTGDPEYGNDWRAFPIWDRDPVNPRWRIWKNCGPYGDEHLTEAAAPAANNLWPISFSDPFTRANGAPANGWTDVGSVPWVITSNQLICGVTGGSVEILYRPNDPYTLNSRVIVVVKNFQANQKLFALTRIAATNSFYYASIGLDVANGVRIVKVVAGANTQIGSNGALSANMVAGHDYRLEFAVRGANPTLLCASVYDLTTSTWLIRNFQPATTDSESILQVKNPAGFMGQVTSGSMAVTLATIDTGFEEFARPAGDTRLLGVGA